MRHPNDTNLLAIQGKNSRLESPVAVAHNAPRSRPRVAAQSRGHDPPEKFYENLPSKRGAAVRTKELLTRTRKATAKQLAPRHDYVAFLYLPLDVGLAFLGWLVPSFFLPRIGAFCKGIATVWQSIQQSIPRFAPRALGGPL